MRSICVPVVCLWLSCAVLGGTALFFAIQTFYLSLQITFVEEQIDTFIDMKERANTSELSYEEAIGYIERYYPAGSKLAEGSMSSIAVERVREDTIRELRRRQDQEGK
jgi:hypothetical protein